MHGKNKFFRVSRGGIKRCIEKCEENKARIASLRDRLIKERANKEGEAQVKAVLDSIDADRAAKQERKDKRQEKKEREKVKKEGNRQYEQMPPDQRAPIDTWKEFRTGGSGSTSEPANWAGIAASGSQTGGAQGSSKGKLVLKKKEKKNEES